jgi:2-C-methyl-D-erythritol 4-phosphate cytidylyltransferase
MGKQSAEKTGTSRKQFMLLEGSPILLHTVRKFAACPLVNEIIVALRADDLEWVGGILAREEQNKMIRTVEGGDSRQESVWNALTVVAPDTDLVAVHDAVRPFVDLETIEEAIHEAFHSGAAIVGIVPVDTVKQVTKGQIAGKAKVRGTIPREKLVLAQTPQVFRHDLLRRAFESARVDGFIGTDEASLVERLDAGEVSVVLGSDRNIKITKPSDMVLARVLLEQESARPLA